MLAAEFIDAIRSVQPPGKWKALVIDEHSKRLLGSVLKNNDILAEKVTGAWACRVALRCPLKPGFSYR